MKPTPSCPDLTLLLDLHRGDLSLDVASNVAQHLNRCDYCQARLATAQNESTLDSLTQGLRDVHQPLPRLPKTIRCSSDLTTPAVRSNRVDANDQTLLSSPADETPAVPTGARFGPFVILDRIGEGGMGDVYHAVDPRLDRNVAIKQLKTHRAIPVEARTRFEAEMKAIAQLSHPNIVTIYEFSAAGEKPYAVFELMTGGSLADRLKKTLPMPTVAAQLMINVAHGIHAAHQVKLVHRDLKPANILLTEKRTTSLEDCVAKVADFGLAKFLEHDSSETLHGMIMGTPSYMAPEQAEGKAASVGPSADIYALGATLYELLCSRAPFKGTTVDETLQMVIRDEPIRPRKINANIPRDLETICLKCLAKRPDDRYATAEAFGEDLQRYLNGDPIFAKPTGLLGRGYRWTRQRPALATTLVIAASLLAALLVGAFWFTYTLAEARHERELARTRADHEEQERRLLEERQADNLFRDHLALTKERLTSRVNGWTWHAIDDVDTAMNMRVSQRPEAELRSVLATALSEPDLRTRTPIMLANGVNTWALAFHPTKPLIALGEGRIGNFPVDLRILLVDLATGETQQTLTYPFGAITDKRHDRVRALAFSPDGRWLVAGTRKGQLHRWDLNQPKPERQTIRLDERAAFQELAFAPDGQALYGCVKIELSGRLMRWETAQWRLTSERFSANCYGGMVVHPDGRAIYGNAHQGALVELDPHDLQRERGTFAVGDAFAQAISPDGRTLATANDGRLTLWETATRQKAGVLREPHREQAFPTDVNVMRFSPDGRFLAAANEFTRHVYLYDVLTGIRIADWRSQGEGIHPIAFGPRGRWLAVGGEKGTALLELNHRPEIHRVIPNPFPVLAAALDAEGTGLAVCGSRNSNSTGEAESQWWQFRESQSPRCCWNQPLGRGGSAQVDTPSNTLAFMIDGRLHVAAKDDTPRTLLNRQLTAVETFAIDPQQYIWVAGPNEVRVFDPHHAEGLSLRYANPSALLTGRGAFVALGLSKSYAAVGGLDGALRLFAAVTPQTRELKPIKVADIDYRNDLRVVAIAPDESWAVVGTESGRAHVVSLPALNVLASWPAHTDRLGDAVFLGPDTFVTGSNDHTLRFWQWKKNQIHERWTQRLSGDITSISIAHRGRILAVTALGERGVHVWDLKRMNDVFTAHQLGWTLPNYWP